MTAATPDQIGALTVLIQTIRPAWDTRAIRPVLDSLAHRDLADLTHAAIRTAQDPAMRRPAAIAFDSDHWRPTVRDIETNAERDARIQAQLDAAAERDRERRRVTDTERAERARRCAAAARAAIRPTLATTTHTEETTR